MKWIIAILIILFVWANTSKTTEVTQYHTAQTIKTAQAIYGVPDEDPDDDRFDEIQQQEVDAATNNCLEDCSGHRAGYEWAEENSVSDEDDCNGNSNSFNEGCINFVNGGSGY